MLPPDNSTTEVSTHSRPKAAGTTKRNPWEERWTFQLTAARRRLDTPRGS